MTDGARSADNVGMQCPLCGDGTVTTPTIDTTSDETLRASLNRVSIEELFQALARRFHSIVALGMIEDREHPGEDQYHSFWAGHPMVCLGLATRLCIEVDHDAVRHRSDTSEGDP